MPVECRALVSGRVQMVMYRDFARRSAARLGIRGTVRNLRDGQVEVVAQGERGALERFLKRLRRGSLLSRVERVDVEWREPSQQFDTFRIVYS